MSPRSKKLKQNVTLSWQLVRATWLGWWHTPWGQRTIIAGGIMAATFVVLFSYYYVTFAHQIDERLHGERERVLPRVFARPLELYQGEAVSDRQLLDRLNDLGYVQRTRAENIGEFSATDGVVSLIPRGGTYRGRLVRATFQRARPRTSKRQAPSLGDVTGPITRLEIVGASAQLKARGKAVSRVTLELPLLSALTKAARQKRRQVPLSAIPTRVIQAVLAIEDRRFYSHPGVDPIGIVGALLTNLKGDKPYLAGASTLTQQLVKNFFLTPEKSIRRKLLEQFMALVLERRASKDEILELYLNEVYLGQRGSFAIHGVAEGARLFFGKDVNNLTLAEAATMAGVIQAPLTLSPFNAPERARERRNVVLQAMVEAGHISADAASRATHEPLTVVARALDAEAPYFVDFVGETLADRFSSLTASTTGLDVYTTLDLHLQRLAEDAVRSGLARVDTVLSRRRRKTGPTQAALIAVDPHTGDVLAMVGGRSYNMSQYNRAVSARRQPGSVFKPFVYLTAFQQAAERSRTDLTPATLVMDEPTTFFDGEKEWTPANYESEYDGPITLRRALAMSRNVATVKVAERVGFGQIAALWKRIGVGTPPHAYPAIALGVFEATPYEIAEAYTLFPNQGTVRTLRTILRLTHGGTNTIEMPLGKARTVTRPDATFLVTNMMRSVISEGTGVGARAMGLTADAAGKTGTTNDLRDAWFVGFTPDLLTVVWVGLDENQALGLSGAQAALPIWATFMVKALAGQPKTPFSSPDNVTFADIDPETGELAGPSCPGVISEAFLNGTEPTKVCELHREAGRQ
jgi:penicillin-binding protein 1B